MIESASNSKVKRLRRLYTKKGRKEEGCFLAEGANIVKDIPLSAKVEEIYAKASKEEEGRALAERFSCECVVLSDDLFDRTSDTVTPSGLTAVVKYPIVEKRDYNKIMILDGISDAGNAGTIIRTAAACGFDAVFAFDSVELYSPKCVRSTMSGIFRIPCLELSYQQFDFDGDVYLLDMDGENVFGFQPNGRYAIVVGSEAKGASQFFRSRADKVLSIPMRNGVESLNAAISASLAMYVLENRR